MCSVFTSVARRECVFPNTQIESNSNEANESITYFYGTSQSQLANNRFSVFALTPVHRLLFQSTHPMTTGRFFFRSPNAFDFLFVFAIFFSFSFFSTPMAAVSSGNGFCWPTHTHTPFTSVAQT